MGKEKVTNACEWKPSLKSLVRLEPRVQHVMGRQGKVSSFEIRCVYPLRIFSVFISRMETLLFWVANGHSSHSQD